MTHTGAWLSSPAEENSRFGGRDRDSRFMR